MAISMLDFSRFKFISFDCYGTLIDWETGLLKALAPILHKHGVEIPDADLLQLYGDFEAEVESAAYRDYRDVLRLVVCRLSQRLGFEASAAEQDSLPNSIASLGALSRHRPRTQRTALALQARDPLQHRR